MGLSRGEQLGATGTCGPSWLQPRSQSRWAWPPSPAGVGPRPQGRMAPRRDASGVATVVAPGNANSSPRRSGDRVGEIVTFGRDLTGRLQAVAGINHLPARVSPKTKT